MYNVYKFKTSFFSFSFSGNTERDFRSRLHYSSNHSTKSRYLRQQYRKAKIQKSEF